MRLFELAYCCRLYGEISRFDADLKKMRGSNQTVHQLRGVKDNRALLVWLNSWGCRQFDLAHHSQAARMLERWGSTWLQKLPPVHQTLSNLNEKALESVADAYEDLRHREAGGRKISRSREAIVSVGPTGAAKILFAVRPNALPPWDDPIRRALKHDASRSGYLEFLYRVRADVAAIEVEARDLGIPPGRIPRALGRERSSLPKMMDEYYWVTITLQHQPPSTQDLALWSKWSRLS